MNPQELWNVEHGSADDWIVPPLNWRAVAIYCQCQVLLIVAGLWVGGALS